MFSIFKRKNNRFVIERLLAKIESLAATSSILVLVPGTTGYNWMGVNRATFALFPNDTVELPHYYSQLHITKQEEQLLIEAIRKGNFKHILFSGFPPYFEQWIHAFQSPQTKITVLYHGFYSEFAGNPELVQIFTRIIDLAKQGKIHQIAFNKEGMAESIAQLCQIKTTKFLLKTPSLDVLPKYSDGKIHIGVLGNDTFRKNIYNQVAAALMIENSVVHVTSDAPFPFLDETRIVREGTGHSHGKFLQILGRMHVNLHLSYSESWGQLTTESLAMGVPCLVSKHSDVLSYDDHLSSELIVENYDSVLGIYQKLQYILNKSLKDSYLIDYVCTINKKAEEMTQELIR